MPVEEGVDEYLRSVPDDQRALLDDLRDTIRSVIPDATETITYRMPTFKVAGRAVVAYAAFRDHCSLFPMGLKVLEDNRVAVEPYLSGKSTLRFTADRPLPKGLVKAIVRGRLEENAARAAKR
ncbi:MAG TPA: DUF1801 domain-containing protein [Actinomycetota bacterium]|nr:DUF1801 domain-containing protein [Actinomycetota bacterium]